MLETKTTKSYKKMGLIEANKICFYKYFDFKGRARRAEYWYFILFIILVSFILGFIEGFTGAFDNTDRSIYADIFSIFIIIPSISVSVRRLHDINRSGWWVLLTFLIIIGSIILLIWHCKDSDKEINRFGPNPK